MNYTQHLHQGVAPGRSMANGGGGGSSGPDNYANLEKLYGEQARAAQFMLDQSMPMLPGTMQNTAGMTQDAMSGALGREMSGRAATESQDALSRNMAAVDRSMARYGTGLNGAAMAANKSAIALGEAANRTGAVNNALRWSEDQKWNRNAGQFAQLSGMGDGAMQGLSSAAGGFGNMAAQQDNKDMANARGYGQMGAALGSALTKKDGGYISVGLANGGDAWAAWKAKNPITTSGRRKSGGNPLGMVAAGAAPHLAAEGLKAAWKGSGAGDAIKGMFTSGPVDATVNGGTQAATLAAQDAAVTGASGISEGTASAMLGEQGATLAAQDAAVTGAAGLTEGTTAALGMADGAGAAGASSGAMAGLAAAAPWLVGGLAIGHALDLFADGGDVQGRKDMTEGGRVTGPGTETSDSIPAWLSKGEYVINADAVKLVGKDKLEKINDKGLEKRYGNNAPGLKRGAPALASGGYLGVAMGAGVEEWNRQQQMAENKRRHDESMAMQKEGLGMQKEAAARQAEQFGWQRKQQEEADRQRRLTRFAITASELAKAGDLEALSKFATEAYGDGNTYRFAPSADGKGYAVNLTDKDGKMSTMSLPNDPEQLQRFILANANPELVLRNDAAAALETQRFANEKAIKELGIEADDRRAELNSDTQLNVANIYASRAGGGGGGDLTESEAGAINTYNDLRLRAQQARAAGKSAEADALELQANGALKGVRQTTLLRIREAATSGAKASKPLTIDNAPKAAQKEYERLMDLPATKAMEGKSWFSSDWEDYNKAVKAFRLKYPDFAHTVPLADKDGNLEFNPMAGVERQDGMIAGALGGGNQGGAQPKNQGLRAGSQQISPLELRPIATDKSGKAVYTWDDYRQLREYAERLRKTPGAEGAAYWEARDRLNNATYRTY